MRRWALTAVAAMIVALAGWAAGPAFSGRPYVPAAVEFEARDTPTRLSDSAEARAAGAQRARGSDRGRTLAGSVRTDKRFNLVGMRWRGSRAGTLHMRVRPDGGAWGRWVAVGVDSDDAPDRGSPEARSDWTLSSPVWAGDANAVEYRLRVRGPVRGLRLHFVNTKGTATALDRWRSRVRGVVSGALSLAGSLVGAHSAAAAGSPPPIVPRQQWGADQCPPRATPSYGSVDVAFVHHTVTATEYGPQDSAAMVLAVCRYHRNSNGWNDIGYNFLVDRYGTIFEGRAGGIDQPVVGAQAQGYNAHSTGIANLGTFSTVGQTDPALGAMARLLSWKLSVHGVPPTGTVGVRSGGGSLNRYPAGTVVQLQRISGHRDADATSCPGDGLYAQLPRLRALVAAIPVTPSTSVSLAATRTHVRYPDKVELSGRLAGPDRSPLGGRNVQIQFRSASRGWRPLLVAPTGADGSFRTRARLSYNRAVRAYFPGEAPGTGAATSTPIEVGVRPRVTAKLRSPAAGTLAPRQRVVLRGKVSPRKRTVLLVVERRAGERFRRVARRTLRTRTSGRVTAGQRLTRSGAYRLRLAALADTKNLGARSDPVEVDVGASTSAGAAGGG
jgi:N-acetylmuramoyl-L-alanine amidase